MRTDYGNGTYLRAGTPWAVFTGGGALCADGKVRNLKRIAPTADTFFSVPASVTVKGKTVTGYVSIDADSGPPVVVFHAYSYGRNGHLLAGSFG